MASMVSTRRLPTPQEVPLVGPSRCADVLTAFVTCDEFRLRLYARKLIEGQQVRASAALKTWNFASFIRSSESLSRRRSTPQSHCMSP